MTANDTRRYADAGYPGVESTAPEEEHNAERAERVRRLKAQIKAGTYRADIKDIAMQLAAAMDPIM